MDDIQEDLLKLGSEDFEIASERLAAAGTIAIEGLIHALRDLDKRATYDAAMTLRKIGSPAEIPLIIALREDPDEEVRCWAAYLLRQTGTGRCVRPLCYALEDSSQEVRLFAAETLQHHPDPAAIRPILEATTREEWVSGVNFAARAALRAIGSAALPALSAVMEEERWSLHRTAACVLQKLAEPETIPTLLRALEHPVANVRFNAAAGLSRLANPASLEPLRECLADEHARVRAAAAEGLARLGDDQGLRFLVASLAADPETAEEATQQLRESFNQNERPTLLMPRLTSTVAACESIQSLGPVVIDALLDALPIVGPTPHLIHTLAEVGDARAVPALVENFPEENPFLRRSVVLSLGRIGDQRARPLLDQLEQDPDHSVRYKASVAIARLGAPDAFERLVAVAAAPSGEKNELDRFWAAREAIHDIAAVGGERALAVLVRLLETDRHAGQAARCLGDMGDGAALEPLCALLRRGCKIVQSSALTQDWNSDTPGQYLERLSVPECRNGAIAALGQLGDIRALTPLRDIMADPDWVVRRKALTAIEQIRTAEQARCVAPM